MPAIAIDNCGGVNLIFYDNRHDPNLADSDHRYAVYYVRITNFGPSATIYQKCLTVDNSTPPQPLPFRVPAPGDVPTFLGDYHHLAVAGANRLYAAYTARKEEQPGSGTWKQNCYLNRIVCTNFGFGDFNGNGLGDPDDITLFYEAYIAADSAADGTADCVVDVADESLFWTEFAEFGD